MGASLGQILEHVERNHWDQQKYVHMLLLQATVSGFDWLICTIKCDICCL
jgi:hypothetical protein